jgi:hypothetical protein
MSAAISAVTPAAQPITHATGPKTPQGKTAAARNAVTHGLHAQDVVLPHLGESHEEFDALCAGLARELSPRTAVERHYVEQIAQAMWRLRRLTRWEASLYDDPALTDEERITKMARVLRHDAALRRHIDRALKALRDTPANCQNELTSDNPSSPVCPNNRDAGEVASLGECPTALTEGGPHAHNAQKCQNEPAPAPTHPLPEGPSRMPVLEVASLSEPEGSHAPPELGAGRRSFLPLRAGALRRARKLKQESRTRPANFLDAVGVS